MKPKILLINPTITSARSARFPLAVLTLAAAVEARYASRIIDGNVDRGFVMTALDAVVSERYAAICITVMGGPQLLSAIAVSKAVRIAAPLTPIIWGGYFPTICPDAALNSSHVDFVIRGQGEDALLELLALLEAGGEPAAIEGLSWKDESGHAVHNPDRRFSAAGLARQPLRYDLIENPGQYLKATYLGRRTAGYQAALGCRYRCSFCGVNAMFQGKTALPAAERLAHDLGVLKQQLGADSITFYDHNFFDREAEMLPLLEVLAKFEMPWWCFARSDALLNLSDHAWALVRKSRLRMAYIGAESPSAEMLRDMRKGTQPEQTLAVVEKCRAMGVTPELSFMLAPPHDPEGETERSFDFIRRIKRLHPGTEIMLYIHTPLPPRLHGGSHAKQRPVQLLRDSAGRPVVYPDSAAGWAQPQWVDYWCHQDAPWLSPRLRRRIQDFTTVLGCRFPTITDIRAPAWQRALLRTAATWRYGREHYDRPWELDALKRFVRLWDPRLASL